MTITDVPDELVVDFDITDPALAWPHERLAEIQAATPVAFSPHHGGHWIVTKYDDVQEVLRNWETFSNFRNQIPIASEAPSIPLEMDPPDHTMFRHILNPLFSPQRMKRLAEAVRRVARELAEDFAAAGGGDLIRDFAHPLPTRIFLAQMGWPLEDDVLFERWVEDVLVGRPGAPPEEDMAFRMEVNQQVSEYFLEMVKLRQRQPTDDATSLIVNATVGDEQRALTDDELLRMLWLLMLGGLHTTRGVLGYGAILLARHPDQRRRLIDDPGLIPGAVEEVLRLEAPVASGRTVAREVELRGVRMEPGDPILVAISAANRDPERFSQPHEFQIDRTPNRHLTFSAGPHRCVGSHLARIELTVGLEEFHRVVPEYDLDPERPLRGHHSQVRGLYELPLTIT